MFRRGVHFGVFCLLALAPSAHAQSASQAQAECLRSQTAIDKIVACGQAMPLTSDPRMQQRLFLRRGNAFMELERYAEAITDFTSLLRVAPKVAGYYDNRQMAYRYLGMFNEAMSDANNAIQLAPDHPFVYRSRGLTFEAMKQYEAAIRDFDRALSFDVRNVVLQVERARIKAKAGRVREAISELSRIIETETKIASALKERGMAYWAVGDFSAAKKDLLAAAQEMPNDPDIPRALAAISSRSQPDTPTVQPPASRPAQQATRSSSGTAFRIAKGLFVTNHHVIDGCATIKIAGDFGGRILASDQPRDLALVSIPNDSGDVASIRNTRILLNETVTAAGFPLQGAFAGIAVTNGTVTRLSGLRGDTGEVQISAPVQPGNSGGPLVDAAGNVIGVVSSKLNALKVAGISGDIPQNVNFAITSATLRAFLDAKNVNYKEVGAEPDLTGVQVAARANGFTVLVECQR